MSAVPFSLEDRNPAGLKQDLTYFLLNNLLPGVMGVLCRLAPVWVVPRSDLVVVTGFDAVQEVFARNDDFEVPYEERVRVLGWKHFLLALQDTAGYERMHDLVTALWRPADLEFVHEIARTTTESILDASRGEIDLVQEVVKPVLLAVVEKYYGVPVPPDRQQPFFDGNLAASGFMFSGPKITKQQAGLGQEAISQVWPVIDAALEGAPAEPGTVLGRYRSEGWDQKYPERLMRSALMAMIGGFLPTDTNASGRIMEVLLSRPEAMRWALDAAQRDDGPSLLAGLQEALRVDYIIPILWRRAARDTVLGEGTKRPTAIRKASILAVSLQSAMLDPRRVPNPKRFDPSRSPATRMIYGHQFHNCIGAGISNAVLTELFRAVLRRQPARRSPTRWAGDYPWHLPLSIRTGAGP